MLLEFETISTTYMALRRLAAEKVIDGGKWTPETLQGCNSSPC